MNVDIKYIKDANIFSDERVVLIVNEDCNLGSFMVMKGKSLGVDSISSRLHNSYWFPDIKVKRGDLVVLYSKKGSQSEKQNPSGSVSYFFYWNKDESMWTHDEDCAVLLEIKNYMAMGR